MFRNLPYKANAKHVAPVEEYDAVVEHDLLVETLHDLLVETL